MKRVMCCVLATLLPTVVLAETVTIPFGTTVFCELEERLATKPRDRDFVEEGDIVRAHVWKDVLVDGKKVIEAGTPVFTRVSKMKKARIAGRKGVLELEVLNVQAVDGRDVALEGGYDKSGKGKMGLTVALAAALAWPIVFLKGKNAFLEPGTVFDAIVRSPTEVEVERTAAAAPKLKVNRPLEVSVPYDDIDPNQKIKELPLVLAVSEGTLSQASVVAVNGEPINPIPVRLAGEAQPGSYRGMVDFKALSGHFTQGMNRFDVQAAGATAEVLLEIEF